MMGPAGGMTSGGGSMPAMAGLPQTMIDVMQGVLSGTSPGSSTLAGVMQGMLDAMDDLAVSPAASTSTGGTAFQTMAQTMESVLAAAAAGTGSTAGLMQSMTGAMHSVLSGTAAAVGGQGTPATGSSAAASISSMMLSGGDHVLAAPVDRAHLAVTPDAGGIMVTRMDGTAQSVQMMGGADTIVATDGQIMTGLNDAAAGPVWRLYQSALGRQPDARGFQGWMAAAQSGTSLQQMAQSFMASPEFQAKYGQMSDTQFLDQLYHNVLGRSGDPAGMAAWADGMAHGLGRDVVLIGFANSAENMANTAAHAGAGMYWVL